MRRFILLGGLAMELVDKHNASWSGANLAAGMTINAPRC